MIYKEPNPDDFPFADLLGLKKKKLTPEQEFGKALLELNKKYGNGEQPPKERD